MFDPDAIDVPAATVAEQRVAAVRGRPDERLALLRSSYAPPPGAPPVHLRYQRAALAFMGWQVRRGLLNRDGTRAYAWDPVDAEPWRPPPGRLDRAVRRIIPPRIA